ncbi:hypothetical protein [Desulfosporosinus sp. Sb-LF]|uniref:hypothetical protein n=1 Tax=Desulfosporosinus sp. Sb-LF TaxID=2560027 RepID=UPI00107FAE55|nr:hypothetical protein [Desulfosporosinus sp. Sb-LF]TGE34317.1 hypothetical protein E4K68_01030 [Desulfosporosinus sp. Sb-LF]
MTLKELCDLGVQKVCTLINQLGSQSMERWPSQLRELPPLSLDSGLPYVPVSQMHYYRTEPIEQHLRVK